MLIVIALVLVAVGGNVLWNHSLRRRVRRQSQSLGESEERYRLLVEASPDALLATGGDRIITFANTTAAAAISTIAAVATTAGELLHERHRTPVHQIKNRHIVEPDADVSVSPHLAVGEDAAPLTLGVALAT